MRIERASSKHLGELLVERGVISRVQVEKALEYQHSHEGVLFGEALVNLAFATEEETKNKINTNDVKIAKLKILCLNIFYKIINL